MVSSLAFRFCLTLTKFSLSTVNTLSTPVLVNQTLPSTSVLTNLRRVASYLRTRSSLVIYSKSWASVYVTVTVSPGFTVVLSTVVMTIGLSPSAANAGGTRLRTMTIASRNAVIFFTALINRCFAHRRRGGRASSFFLCFIYLKRRGRVKRIRAAPPPVSSRWVCDKRGGGRGGFSPPTLMES